MCRNSTTRQTAPSISIVVPVRKSLLEIARPNGSTDYTAVPKSRQFGGSLAHQRFKAVLIALLGITCSIWQHRSGRSAPGQRREGPAAILRDALPFDQDDIRELQHRLELTSDDLRAKRWSALSKTVSRSEALLSTRRRTILDAVPASRRDQADALLDEVNAGLEELKQRIGASDKPGFIRSRRSTLSRIGDGSVAGERIRAGHPLRVRCPATSAAAPRSRSAPARAISPPSWMGYNARRCWCSWICLSGVSMTAALHPRRRLQGPER